MIRPAVMQDAQACFELAKDIYGAFLESHGIPVVDEDLRKTVDYFLQAGQVLVIERDAEVVGMYAYILVGHPANQSCKILQEVLWCSRSSYPTDALAMLRAIEQKARDTGANIVVLANLDMANEQKLKRIYGRMGYTYLETHYARVN